MLKKILMTVALVVGVLIYMISLRPDNFHYERSITITAPVDVVFAQVNDFHNWANWSPWAKLDPNAKNTFEGPSSGAGAIFKWSGNDQVGEGIETITESRLNERIDLRLEFLKPFKATNGAAFEFKTQGNQTIVTWSMFGKNDFVGKAMGFVFNCDKMIGEQFEKGLEQLKSVAEGKVQ